MNENNTPTQASQLSEKKIYSIGLHRIRPMQNHPFSVRDDEEMGDRSGSGRGSSVRCSVSVWREKAMKRLQDSCRMKKCLSRKPTGRARDFREAARKHSRTRTDGVKRPLPRC